MINNYAEVVDGVCINIIVADSDLVAENMSNLILYTDSNPAHIDGIYENGYFYPPQPFPSWSKDNQGNWVPPIPKPVRVREENPNSEQVIWDEENLQWVWY